MIRGREAELARLAALLDTAAGDRAVSVLVTGMAGIGKTALLDEVARRARAGGARVVRAAAPEGGEDLRYALVDDLVRGLAMHLAQIDPEDAAVLRALSASADPGAPRVAGALLHLVSSASVDQPVLLLVDDLHWADPDSVAAMTIAVGRLLAEPVMILAAMRPAALADPRLARWEPIDLGPLDIVAAVDLLTDTCGLSIPVDHAQRIVRALECTPLAIVESPRLLSSAQISGSALLPDPMPVGGRLVAAWAGAARALPERSAEALLVLCALADSGSPLLDATLAARGLTQDDLVTAIQAGLVVRRDGRPEASHALVRAAILQGCDPHLLAAIHRSAASAARELGTPPEVLVGHLLGCASPGDEHTAQALERAADQALAAGRIRAAVRAWEGAARISDDPADRTRRAASAGRALLGHSVDLCEAGPLLTLVGGLDLSDEDRVWVAFLEAEHLAQSDVVASIDAAREALAAARVTCPALVLPLAWSIVGSAWAVPDMGCAVESARLFLDWEPAHPQATGPGFPRWTGRALLGAALFSAGQYADSAGLLAEARRLSRGWGMPGATTTSELLYVTLIDIVMQDTGGHVDDRLHVLGRRLVHDRGDTLAYVEIATGMHALRRGAWAVARSHLDSGLALARGIRGTEELLFGLGVAVELDALTGDRAALDADATELRSLSRRVGAPVAAWAADRAFGLAALGQGDVDQALGSLQPLASAPLTAVGHREQPWRSQVDLIEALVHSGDLDAARQQLTDLHPALVALGTPLAGVLLERSRALLAPAEDAEAHFRRALATATDARCPFETARTHLALGQHLRRTRLRAKARAELRLAAAGFEQLGAPGWFEQAREELRAAGSGAPRARRDPLAGLTSQERRVAGAVATGATNREIAAALFLSQRTVEYHLVSVFRKCGVTNRTGLAHLVSSAAAGGSTVHQPSQST